MTHNWKHGDVAVYDDQRVMLVRTVAGRLAWVDDEGDERNISRDVWDGVFRPLLVIDPEDRAQIMRLADAWDAQTDVALEDGEPMSLSGWHMQAALRSLLEPKPEEPTTWLAEVVDSAGDHWFRAYERGMTPWVKRRSNDDKGMHLDLITHGWEEIPRPLTVLSPGYVEEGE